MNKYISADAVIKEIAYMLNTNGATAEEVIDLIKSMPSIDLDNYAKLPLVAVVETEKTDSGAKMAVVYRDGKNEFPVVSIAGQRNGGVK